MRSNKKSILGIDCLLSETETREVYRRLYSRGKTKPTDSELLYLAVSEGNLGRVQSLLNGSHIEVNFANQACNGNTPLHCAVIEANKEIVKVLLAHPDIKVNAANNSLLTPLHFAVQKDNKEIVELLLSDLDIDVNAADDSLFTPLHSAVGLEKIDVVHLLLSHPTIDVNAVNSAGRTPLHLAVPYPYSYLEFISNKTKIAAFLLDKGANINIRDVDGLTPLDKAMKYAQKELILLLTRYSCVANMWTHWEDLQPLYNNYMQWLPKNIVQDIEVLCPQEKNRWRFWAPPEPQYDSYIPWLPREMVEDVAILVKADVINGDLISTPKPL